MATLTVYVDESARAGRYTVAGAVVDESRAAELRVALRHYLRRGRRRIHFHREPPSLRNELLTVFADLPVTFLGWTVRSAPGVSQHVARDLCLRAMIADLQAAGEFDVVLESRQDDRDDQAAFSRYRLPSPRLAYRHLPAGDEPLLWLADGAAWALSLGRQIANCNHRQVS